MYKRQNNWRYDLYFINKCQIVKHKKEELSDKQITELERLNTMGDIFSKLGTSILLDKTEEAEQHLTTLSKKQNIRHINEWPITDFIRKKITDPNLKRYITEHNIV